MSRRRVVRVRIPPLPWRQWVTWGEALSYALALAAIGFVIWLLI